jgi:hypothetical protein
MFATPIVRKILAMTSVLVAANSFASVSYADNCSSGTMNLGFGAGLNTGVYSTRTLGPWKLGDCELSDAAITFDHGKGVFDAHVATHFTHSKDIWHFKMRVLTGTFGKPSEQTEQFATSWDSPPLSEQDNPLFHHWVVNFKYNSELSRAWAEVWSCC